MKKIIYVILFTQLFASCTFTKRVYRPGYYVQYGSPLRKKPKQIEKDLIGYSLNAYDALSTKPICENSIDAALENEIIGNEGTLVQIPANAFVLQNGKAMKCNKVTITLKEYYNTSDILEAGLTTSSNNRILATAGMIYIEATCNAEKLKLKKGKIIKIYMKTNDPDKSMHLFEGNMEKGIVNWRVKGKAKLSDEILSTDAETGEGERYYEGESESMGAQYLMESSKLGWINCDKFYDVKEKTNLIVTADSIEKSFVALVFKNMKSVLPGYAYSNKIVEFTALPEGEDVTIILYRVDIKNDIAWFGTEDVVLGDTNLVRVNVNEITIPDFKIALKNFN